MSAKFTHLHTHSHYSLLDGLAKIDELLDYTKSNGMDSVALTDHGVLYGAVEFYKKAKKAGVKPIMGCEVYCALETRHQKRPNIDQKRYHLILLAKDTQGYRNLIKIVTKSHLEGFYYKPRVDEQLLTEYSEGIIALSACIQGRVPRLAINNKIELAKEQALKYQQIFGKENFFLEIQDHPNLEGQVKANKVLIDFSKKLNIPLVATNDIHYLSPNDAEAQDILMLINTGAKAGDENRLTMMDENYSMRSPAEMAKFCEALGVPEAIENTQKITEMCNFELKLGETRLPHFETPQNQTPDQYLKELCEQGLEKKDQEINDKDVAIKRLEYELSVIKETGFASYFLIVADFVNWAKQNRIIVGPGRGSAGGSLVSYLLNVIEVNPLKYDLIFERFLNPSRISMPDIDLDFADKRRDEVINYISEKYGKDRVAQIITFGTMASRAAIKDVGRALGINYDFCDKISKMIPPQHTLDDAIEKVIEFRQLYQTDTEAQKLIDLAKKLEGCCRHASTHACGVVISKEPLDESVPLQRSTKADKESVITQYEMHSIDDLGLLKIDLLGLKNLTIIENTLTRIYKVQNKSIDLSKIPIDDEKTFDLFRKAQTTSVFQLESEGMKRCLKELKPTEFEDIVTMIALYRPGPIQFIPEYIARKHGRKTIEYLHPKLKPILDKTQGICVFQEQLMQIARDLAGFTMAEADVLRKAVGKKIIELLHEQEEKFIQGCIKNDVSEKIAKEVWEWILPFAQYGFNRSHSVPYAMIAYNTAYLKAHFPVEFMAAVLTSERSDIERLSFLIDECKEMNVEVLQPDINESFHNFSVVPNERKVRFGLLAVKNVGGNIVTEIIRERKENGEYKSFSDFTSRINTKDFNKKSLESLIKAGAFDKFEERHNLLGNIDNILNFNREIRKSTQSPQSCLFDALPATNPPSLQLAQAVPITTKEKLDWEKDLLGLYISAHPLDSIKNILREKTLAIKELKENIPFSRITVGGVISSVKKIITKKGQPMVFMKLEDLTDKVEVVVFPSILEANPDIFQENKIVFVSGKVDRRDNEAKVICNTIEEIKEV